MPLKLMYITNQPQVARIAEKSGVERIFADMEFLGKGMRQGGMDSVQNHHTLDDVARLREALTTSELLVRVNPIHDAVADGPFAGYPSSEDEIDAVIAAGAQVLMLPYYQTVEEAERFLRCVGGRATTMLLVETARAAECLEQTLALPGIDEVYIGLNDLSLCYGMSFMFELLANGMVERMCSIIRQRGIPYGFGGIAAVGKGAVPAELIIREHYRLGSSMVILSRSFCNAQTYASLDEMDQTFSIRMRDIRALEQECEVHANYFWNNQRAFCDAVADVLETRGQSL